MDLAKFAKQVDYYLCGPTSLQGLVWNDPKAPSYHDQYYWAANLGTTTSSGTYIGNLKNAINSYTHWDDSDYAGAYVVVGISSWTNANYKSLFQTHTKSLRSPIQLHPKLIQGQTTSYYQGTTDGHFNVGAGYDFTVNEYVIIFEPAGASGAYPPITAAEDLTHLRLAQAANTGQQNIAY
jgi:hypothetical protein